MELIVDKSDNSIRGNRYPSIKEAIAASKSGDIIRILPGEYLERVVVLTPGISLVGEDPENTVISWSLGAKHDMYDGNKRGTFRSYTMLVYTHDVTIENLTIANTAGAGAVAGQAIALYTEGDHIHVKNCHLKGHQDTLFTGPLPDEEISHGGFVGPTENAPRIVGRQWFENCVIEGDVDFIFGGARAIFTNCEIVSLHRDNDPEGYVTAPCTEKGEDIGYVFKDCQFTSRGCGKDSVYLSRPWRDYAKTVYINCQYGDHIKTVGFHDWKKEIAHTTSYYAEYPMVDGRCDWAHAVEECELSRYTVEAVYGK